MKTRLFGIDNEFDQDLKKYSHDQRLAITVTVLELLMARFDLSNAAIEDCVEHLRRGEKVPGETRKMIQGLMKALEDRLLGLEESLQHGNAREEDVAQAFRSARFANAAYFATSAGSHEALAEVIYEAHHALDGLDEIKALLNEYKQEG